MMSIFYISKRTFFDIIHSAIFWVAIVITAFACFAVLYIGWKSVNPDSDFRPHPHHREPAIVYKDPDSSDSFNIDPFSALKPKDIIYWITYGVSIGFANLLSIFIAIGLLSRDIENRLIELLLVRPVSRGQIYFGKLFASWIAVILFLLIITLWVMICSHLSGIGFNPKYFKAVSIGVLSPIIVCSIVLTLSLWMKGLLAGLIGTAMVSSSSSMGILMIYGLGVVVLNLKTLVYIIFKILPPLNVIGEKAALYIDQGLYIKFMQQMYNSMLPVSSGLYLEMWQVYAYLGVAIFLGWLSIFRRQFS